MASSDLHTFPDKSGASPEGKTSSSPVRTFTGRCPKAASPKPVRLERRFRFFADDRVKLPHKWFSYSGDAGYCPERGENHLSDKKNLPGDKKNLSRDEKNLPGDKKNHPGDKKNLPGDKKNHPGDKKNLSRDEKNLPGDEKNLPGDKKNHPGDKNSFSGRGNV
ncbi:MAG: hypothetical protein LBH72_03500 [Proteiniphilum sp.]|jgi:hypothetical protein|nr:hypothetical protein [Proteiniphilum sp.]